MIWWQLEANGTWTVKDRFGHQVQFYPTLRTALEAWAEGFAPLIEQHDLAALHSVGDDRVVYLAKEGKPNVS